VIRAIVTDIEGTTTSLSFVKDVLFPFARRELRSWLAAHAGEPRVRAELDAVQSLEPGDPVATLERWIDEDRKATPLKALQGWIWADGYANGELRGHVYDDVTPVLRTWRERGLRLFVYSSGSVVAQKLLFGHSVHGDLAPLFEGFFDTTTGPKVEAESYRRIAASIGLAPGEVLFLSDAQRELDAAREAGLRTTGFEREGTAPVGGHPLAAAFSDDLVR
jgi:enolase-phosphatase E1